MSLVVVETETANVGSVVNMCRRLGGDPVVSDDPGTIASADKLLLPGVGAFDAGMASLHGSGLVEVVRLRASEGVPVLGICLGMQLLFDSSEEGVTTGLGLIPGVVRRLPMESPSGSVRIPHMGWSRLEYYRPHDLTEGIGEEARFYFVHSYAAVPDDDEDIVGVSTHGSRFVSAVARQNVLGVQFHPEKSHRYGKALLGNFLRGF
jgi:glutamine amidotransferase